MELSRVRYLIDPRFTLLDIQKLDRVALEDQIMKVGPLAELLEHGTSKLVTFGGLLQDLFAMLFSRRRKIVRQTGWLMVNREVLEKVLALDEVRRLLIHTPHKRVVCAITLAQMARKILDAIPDPLAEKQNQLAAQGLAKEVHESQPGADDGTGPGVGEETSEEGPEGPESDESSSDADSPGDSGADSEDPDGDEGTEGVPEPGAGSGMGSVPAPGSEAGDDAVPGDSQGQGDGSQPQGDERSAGSGAPGPERGHHPDPLTPTPGGSSDESGTTGSGSGEVDPQLKDQIEAGLRAIGLELAKSLAEVGGQQADNAAMLDALAGAQGWDLSRGIPGVEDPSTAFQLCAKMAQDQSLVELMKQFGQTLPTFAQSVWENRTIGRGSAEVGRTVGSDPELVPPDELWRLTHPELRLQFLQDLVDGVAPQVTYREERELGYGPMVVLFDISSSTKNAPKGDKRTIANFIKGLTLAFQRLARVQGRKVFAIPFNTRTMPAFDLTRPTLATMASLAGTKPTGGTDFYTALKAGLKMVAENHVVPDNKLSQDHPPELILITDGQCSIPCNYPSPGQVLATRKELLTELTRLRIRLRAIHIGVNKDDQWRDKHLDQLVQAQANRGANLVFLRDIDDRKNLGRLFESL